MNTINELLHKYKITGLLVYELSERGGEKLHEVHERVYVYNTGRKYVPEFVPRSKLLVSDSIVKPLVDDLQNTLSLGRD